MSGITQGFNEITPQYLGAMCSEYRRYKTNATQEDVANEIGCSREVVSKFERGRNANSVVFMWYIKHGLFDWCHWSRWNGWDLGL